LSKPLGKVADRLDLLGHTVAQCEKYFCYYSGDWSDTNRARFDQLRVALAAIDVPDEIGVGFYEAVKEFHEPAAGLRLARPDRTTLPGPRTAPSAEVHEADRRSGDPIALLDLCSPVIDAR
jgi:hypothetical protein